MTIPLPASDIFVLATALLGTGVFGYQTLVNLVHEIRYRRIRKFALSNSDVGRIAAEILPLIDRARTRKGNSRATLFRSSAATLSAAAHLWHVIASWYSKP